MRVVIADSDQSIVVMGAKETATPKQNAVNTLSKGTSNVLSNKWGFCGTTSEFCNSECQNKDGCPSVSPPLTCTERTDAAAFDVRIGYYNMAGANRPCDAMQPEGIAAGALTHINVAFGTIKDNKMVDETEPIVARTSTLKKKYPGLRVNIAIGGWVFNDPPTEKVFSDIASSSDSRTTFAKSLVQYIRKHGLDGVDFDWEYPVARDRGGTSEDYDNFVKLCEEIRAQFTREDPGWELTITLPSSYWYLRGFNLKGLADVVDWFNIMSYDIHGLWDQKNIWTGPYLKGHTNLTEIEDGMNLLWRNGVDPSQVVMGYGFYGRSFTVTDTGCTTPDGCTFDGAGFAGDCTNEPGILSYAEVVSKRSELGSDTHYDEASSVKYMVYGANQWISYDDEESFTAKKKFMSKLCLKGLMIWAVDLDTSDYQAMTALMGDELMAGALDGRLDPKDKAHLAQDLAAWTGQDCYVESQCASQKEIWAEGKARCEAGFMPIAHGHSPVQINARHLRDTFESCKEGEFKQICCPIKSTPHHCKWNGAPSSGNECTKGCGSTEFELTSDPFTDREGTNRCSKGSRSLCCDATAILQKCHWSDCGFEPGNGSLCKDDEVKVATRMDKDDGDTCPGYTGMGNGGPLPPTRQQYYRSFCCPKNDPFENCRWDNTNPHGRLPPSGPLQPPNSSPAERECLPQGCIRGELKVAHALLPDTLYQGDNHDTRIGDCLLVAGQEVAPEFSLCCDPPSVYSKKWPVEPSYLWSHAYNSKDDDVTWDFADNFGNNNADKTPNDMETDPGRDPYGFVMLDGPPGSINNAFGKDFTVLMDEEPPKSLKRRSFVTTNQTVLDSTFDHAEETIRVFCNQPADSPACRRTFYKGAKDTIIRLPDHVGEGPYARIVSMEPEEGLDSMPPWVIRRRQETRNRNGVYVVKFDYNFGLIKPRADEQVNMRVDFTNLMDYWDTITAAKPDKRRSVHDHLPFDDWKRHVDKAKTGSIMDHGEKVNGTTTFSATSNSINESGIEKRWFGSFINWLKKITTITKEEKGVIPMGISKMFTLFSGRLFCKNDAGATITAGIDITTEVSIEMQGKYAYYFSGTVVPPSIIDTYAYVGAQPRLYAGIAIDGNAELGYNSPTKRLITTLTYPGLSIKGIATVGPSLDLWGRIDGSLRVSGNIKAGVSYTFSPIDVYLPNEDRSHDSASTELSNSNVDEGLQPTFEANVKAEIDFNIRVTPEIDMGIKVGGGLGPLTSPLVDAHVAAYTNTTLNFNAVAEGNINGNGGHYRYSYSVNFLYRVGIAAVAEIIKYGSWRTDGYFPFDWQKIVLYSHEVNSLDKPSKRFVRTEESLPDAVFGRQPQNPMTIPDSPWESIGGFTTSSNASVHTMSRRKEIEFTVGGSTFKCNSDAGSVCSSDSEPQEQFGRSLEVSQLARRAPSDCKKKLPLLMYNCALAFMPVTYTGETGIRIDLPGLCSNIVKFFQQQSTIENRWTMAWDSKAQGRRRRQVCKTGACAADNQSRRKDMFKDPSQHSGLTITNCDEFPFASAEEGGREFYSSTGGASTTCVPEWQNQLQGNCNKLLNNLKTNIDYFNDAEHPSDALPDSGWKQWTNSDWLRKKGFGGMQRLARYPDRQPPAGGLSAADRQDVRLSYYHKRNFTVVLTNPDPDNSPETAWPDGNFKKGTIVGGSDKGGLPSTTKVDNAAYVLCAINTQGQQRYKFTSFNAYCWDGTSYKEAAGGWTESRQYFGCNVDFEGSPFVTRRSVPDGYIGSVPFYSAKIVHVTIPHEDLTGQDVTGDKPVDNTI
ncbi:hypothetical protein NLG97_g3552 [Lecanicillium saksenae]|uniref:Uncharacterized protein n=1 Tax=Lecanicillium saksenae TaxID=468837 RepID=A0ACC1QZK8_9HYPO|nr:hypothetical protein NLG97_g3552 [Lecanicillium saksenae]